METVYNENNSKDLFRGSDYVLLRIIAPTNEKPAPKISRYFRSKDVTLTRKCFGVELSLSC